MANDIKKQLKELIMKAGEQGMPKEEVDRFNYLIDNIEKTIYPDWNKKEKQHIVPKTFLEWFIEKEGDGLFVYDLMRWDFLSLDKIPIDNMLKEENIYVFKDKTWKDNFFFEKFTFSMVLEWWLKEVIKKISNHTTLENSDWQILSWFIAFQFTRTKKFIKKIWERNGKFKKIDFQTQFWNYEDFQSHIKTESIDMDDPKSFYDFMHSKEDNLVMSEEDSMIRSMHLGNLFWPLLLNAHYEILETKKTNFFLCSDNPFFIIPPQDWSRNIWLGIIEPRTAEKIIPINKKQCLRITIFPEHINHWVSLSYSTINQKETNRINQYVYKNAERFILSKEKEYLEYIISRVDHTKLNKDKNRNSVVEIKKFPIVMDHSFYPY